MPRDFNYDMADILDEVRQEKIRNEQEQIQAAKDRVKQAKVSKLNSDRALKSNFTVENIDKAVTDIKAQGLKPTRERIAHALTTSLPTLRKYIKIHNYKIK